LGGSNTVRIRGLSITRYVDKMRKVDGPKNAYSFFRVRRNLGGLVVRKGKNHVKVNVECPLT